jgi:Na+/proline symporter
MERLVATAPAAERTRWEELQDSFRQVSADRRAAATSYVQAGEAADPEPLRAANARLGEVRTQATALYRQLAGNKEGDGDFIFPHFFLRQLPTGILGLVIAAIFIAAMSSLDAQLNSLATSSVMDLYVRARPAAPNAQILRTSRWATLFWGGFATISAYYVASLGQMIEAVNVIGSMFYGSLFGVFLLGWLFPAARGRDGWIGLAGGFAATMYTHFVINADKIDLDGQKEWPVGFLWYNVIGCAGVLLVGNILALWRRWR